MSGSHAIWLEFAACVAIIAVAGSRLVRYGDALATLTGMSRSWIGMILMATVTSLPELVTGLSAVTVAATPDIAVGDALGSTVFNLALLALAEGFSREGSLYAGASRSHLLTAGASIVMMLVVVWALHGSPPRSAPSIGHVSLFSVLLVALYGLAMRAVYNVERTHTTRKPPDSAGMTLRQAVGGYALAAAFIVLAGIWLPLVGVQLARLMGWSDSFVGTLLIALATSMPELVTTLASLRLGAIDLALGNILGSNLFDLLIVALDDIAFVGGPLYRDLSTAHTVTTMVALGMTVVVIAALLRPPRSRWLGRLSWAGAALAILYVFSAVFQSAHGA